MSLQAEEDKAQKKREILMETKKKLLRIITTKRLLPLFTTPQWHFMTLCRYQNRHVGA